MKSSTSAVHSVIRQVLTVIGGKDHNPLLSRRPREDPTGEQMQMDMKNGLTGVPAIVDDHAIAGLIKAFLLRKCLRHKEQVSNQLPVILPDAVNIGEVFFRHDEDMDRRLRIEVLEGNSKLILVDHFRGDLLFDDPAEDAVLIKSHAYPFRSPEKLLKKQLLAPV
jgi:hypothetical protein